MYTEWLQNEARPDDSSRCSKPYRTDACSGAVRLSRREGDYCAIQDLEDIVVLDAKLETNSCYRVLPELAGWLDGQRYFIFDQEGL